MEMTAYRPGTPSWVDLGSPDQDAAAEFYAGLFGGTCEQGPPETGGYRVCTLRGRLVAGIGPAQRPGRPYWTTYVSVTDADTTAKAVRDHGGRVLVEPTDVLTMGRMAVLADPSRAPFSIWQPRDHIGAGLVNEPGTLSWNELATRNTDTARRFYPAVFGWEPQAHGTRVHEVDLGGRVIRMDGNWPADLPAHWMPYFAVDDSDAAAARVAEQGGTVPVPPTTIEVGRFAVLNDPQGAVFSVITLNPS